MYPESHFCSVDMSFLFVPAYCPRKSWGGGQFAQHLFVLRCNWTAFQIFQELGMVPNFQIVQIIEYIHRTLHLRTARKTIGISTLPCLSIVTARPKYFARTRSFWLFLLCEHRRSSRSSTWFQTCIG